ncbi:hypothetical protein Tcan_06765 [Toxocara canis]|uniref:Uncharacterized protein n=1 Tax=Toxocara canis TaxID=6265 RepID=A0A0B2VGZ4_TOXCA|nr:hypothetical protein Tcan_06765 [Toxocara canis]
MRISFRPTGTHPWLFVDLFLSNIYVRMFISGFDEVPHAAEHVTSRSDELVFQRNRSESSFNYWPVLTHTHTKVERFDYHYVSQARAAPRLCRFGNIPDIDPLLTPIERREVRTYNSNHECFDCCCTLVVPLVIVIAMAVIIIVFALLA